MGPAALDRIDRQIEAALLRVESLKAARRSAIENADRIAAAKANKPRWKEPTMGDRIIGLFTERGIRSMRIADLSSEIGVSVLSIRTAVGMNRRLSINGTTVWLLAKVSS